MDRFIDEMASCAELGVQAAIVMPVGASTLGLVDRLGTEVIPRLSKL